MSEFFCFQTYSPALPLQIATHSSATPTPFWPGAELEGGPGKAMATVGN